MSKTGVRSRSLVHRNQGAMTFGEEGKEGLCLYRSLPLDKDADSFPSGQVHVCTTSKT